MEVPDRPNGDDVASGVCDFGSEGLAVGVGFDEGVGSASFEGFEVSCLCFLERNGRGVRFGFGRGFGCGVGVLAA